MFKNFFFILIEKKIFKIYQQKIISTVPMMRIKKKYFSNIYINEKDPKINSTRY